MGERKLKFQDRWMFNRVLCEEEVCRKVLRAAPGIEAGEIAYLNAEQCFEPLAAGRGVRLDVFARGDGRVYDIEMQVARERDLGRRMRYYQAAMDVGELGSGEDFGALPESYVLFFCRHDAYGKGEPAYVIERRCGAHPDLAVGDASPWVVLNASAWEASADPGLRDVLRYLRTGEAEGPLSSEIDALVGVFNEDREWVDRVLTYEQETEMRCRKAREEGREEGGRKVGRKARPVSPCSWALCWPTAVPKTWPLRWRTRCVARSSTPSSEYEANAPMPCALRLKAMRWPRSAAPRSPR